jgi:rubrerythrin
LSAQNQIYRQQKEEQGVMAKTEEFLAQAFAGESQANRKYLAFAEKADKEGYPQAARLFRAAAEAETIHAHNHLRALKGIGDTTQNLKAAVAGETFEFKQMYPEMIEAAKAEGNKAAEDTSITPMKLKSAGSFTASFRARGHRRRIIPIMCVHLRIHFEGHPPGVCPVCNVKGPLFKKID